MKNLRKSILIKIKRSVVLFHFRKIANTWSTSHVSTYSASVAYYTIFSIAPLLVIAISISSIFIKTNEAQSTIITEFYNVFGQNGANFIQMLIHSKETPQTSILLSVIGFIVLLIGATGIFSQLQKALDSIFLSLPRKITHGIWSKIRQKILSLGMVLSVGFLLLVSLIFSATINIISKYVSQFLPIAQIFIHISELIISFSAISFLLALLYKVLPSRRLSWRPALIGGFIAGILFMVSKYALALYLGSSNVFTSYGAASSMVLIIMWAYYMSQVFLLTAILVRLYVIPHLKSKTESLK